MRGVYWWQFSWRAKQTKDRALTKQRPDGAMFLDHTLLSFQLVLYSIPYQSVWQKIGEQSPIVEGSEQRV